MASGAEQEVGPGQPGGRPAQVTTIRKAIVIGAVVALLVGGASSLATARLTDRQSDLDEQGAEITQLASRVGQQEGQIAQLANQVDTLEAEKASREEQLSQILNPTPAPAPTALLSANWVARAFPESLYISVCVEIENTSTSASLAYAETQFSAVDRDNFVYPHNADYPMRLTPLGSGQLSPGQKARGELMFHVPVDAVLTRLVFVWNAGSGATFPEIAVDLPAALTFYSSNSVC